MQLDPVILSRLQFAWVIGWHILLPAFTVGLASFVALLEGPHFVTGREIYFRISSFWIRIFSVSFGMGVVSGVVMPFQFGTNWSRFSDATANVLSPLLAYEGLMAFFLEAAFLGVLLVRPQAGAALGPFRRRADGGARHPVLVVLDPLRQQLDADAAGYEMVDGRFFPMDVVRDRLQPLLSLPPRAYGLSASTSRPASSSLGVAAFYRGDGRFVDEGATMLSMTLWLLPVLVPLQIFLGDQHGLNTLELSAGQARRDRSALGDATPCAADAVRDPRPEGRRRTDYDDRDSRCSAA